MNAVQLPIDERSLWGAPLEPVASSLPTDRGRRFVPGIMAMSTAAVDVLVVAGSFLAAYGARFSIDETIPTLGFDRYLRLAALEAVFALVLLATHGLYQLERPQSWPLRLRGIASSSATALVLAISVSYFLGDQAFSRVWLTSGWICSVVGLALWRTISHRLYERVRNAFTGSRRVLIVGANRLGREVALELSDDFEVVGYVDNGSDVDLDVPLIGPISHLEELVGAYAVDELVIALPANRLEQVNRIVARGFRRHVQVKIVPELGDLLPERFEVHQLGGRHYIGIVPVAAVSWMKRAMDLFIVTAGLLVISPLLLSVAVAIKLDSSGPIFYRQRRVGKNGRHFEMFKFRSMVVDAESRLEELKRHNEATGPLFKMRRDPRVTRVGGFLRRWSIDELPQLLNVLRGEMSLVGPRPPLPSEVAKYEDWQLGRLRAVPGLTGLWQVSGRSEVPFHDMVRLDLHYIRNWSLALDVEILLQTIPAVLTNRGAY